jgi:hypothetical protein
MWIDGSCGLHGNSLSNAPMPSDYIGRSSEVYARRQPEIAPEVRLPAHNSTLNIIIFCLFCDSGSFLLRVDLVWLILPELTLVL